MKPKRKRLPETVWRELRTAHAAGCGLRELARNAGVCESTLLNRSRREQWSADVQRARTLLPAAPADINPALAAASIFEKDNRETKRALSRYARRAAHAAAEHDDPLAVAQQVRHVTAVASAVHGWEGSEKESSGVHVNVAILRDPGAFGPV